MLAMTVTRTATPAQLPPRRTLTRRRKALGWSQNSWARRAGKKGSYVSNVMSGKLHSPRVYRELIATLEIGEASDGLKPVDPGPA